MTNEISKSVISADDPNAIFTTQGLEQALKVCQHFMASRALPQSYTTPQAVLMAIQAGRELGMKPLEAINGMMVINGQIKLWGTALTGRVTRLGYKIKWGTCTDQEANVSIVEPDGTETGVENYTIEDAKKAQLLGKKNWTGHAKVMLRWRALSNAVKFNFPHLLQGHSVVEDDDDVTETQGEPIVINMDNASKLLEKKEEIKVIEEPVKTENSEPVKEQKTEIIEAEKVEAKIIETKENPEVIEEEIVIEKISGQDLAKLMDMINVSDSNKKDVENYFETNLENFSPEQTKQAFAILNKKISDKNKPQETAAAKAMREAKEKAVLKKNIEIKKEIGQSALGIPAPVCQYINLIDNEDEAGLPSDIMLLKLDTSKGKFRNYDAYPSLRAEMEKKGIKIE